MRTILKNLSRHSAQYIPVRTKWRTSKGRRIIQMSKFNDPRKSLTIATGDLARFADGSATAQVGDTSVMVTAIAKTVNNDASSFLPLTVDYRQKSAAAGRIPTNHLRREMGVTDKEILTSRMIDRSLRPLFPSEFKSETQIMCNLLAVDGENDPEVLSINAASAALAVSDIPWDGPVGAVRVGVVDGEVIINPTRRELQRSKMNLVVTGNLQGEIVMMEAGADLVELAVFTEAILQGLAQTTVIAQNISEFASQHGLPKRHVETTATAQEVVTVVKSMSETSIMGILRNRAHHKTSRDEALSAVRKEVIESLQAPFPYVSESTIAEIFHKCVRDCLRDLIFKNSHGICRCDGRSRKDVRPISCSVNVYPPLHGSALFQRGQTQVLSAVTFDSPAAAAKVDTLSALMGGIKEKNFFLHYEFPPYAINELGKVGQYGRRELGHGALAEKGLVPIMPADFPFTTRITAEVLESNGSSSMASICGGTLALMDAGVPISEPVAGVSVGLVTREPESDVMNSNGKREYVLLHDILGIEDFAGDMDFKIAAGANQRLTALQLDTKLPGVPYDVIFQALDEATYMTIPRILSIMSSAISSPREERKSNGPLIETLELPATKRSKLVGLGGVNIKKLMSETGVTLTPIDENSFQLFAPNKNAYDEAKERIEALLAEQREPQLEFGAIYTAKIVEMREFGVLVQLHPAMQPVLVHNSQLDNRRVRDPAALGLEVGQEIKVKYFGRDPVSGNIRVSRKILLSTGSLRHQNLMKASRTTLEDHKDVIPET